MSLEIRSVGQSATQDITADTDFSNMPITMEQRLDIACGQALQTGWIGMDIADIEAPVGAKYIKHDVLSFPWPIEDESIYEARCSHFVEHIPHQLEGCDKHKNGLVIFMEEIHRVLMDQGIVTIACPYYSSQRAWQDPTHVRGITENTFKYFDPQWAKTIGMDHYNIKTNFEVLTTKMILDPSCEGRNPTAQQYMMKHFMNVVMDIHVVLRKRSK
jgi:hypothetical protein